MIHPLIAYNFDEGVLLLQECFDIIYAGQAVGKMQVVQESLYYRFRCTCQFLEEGLYRIVLEHPNGQTDLGVCILVDNKYCLDKRIPTKRVATGKWFFTATGKRAPINYIPVYEDRPFEHVSYIHKARFVLQNGIPGLSIIDRYADPQDNGQSP